MKHSKGFLLLLAASAVVSAQAADEAYLIRRTFTEGEKLSYKVSTVSDMTADMMGQQSQFQFQSGMVVALTFAKINKETGAAEITGKVTDNVFKMEPDMSGGQLNVPKEFVFTGKLSNRFELSDVKFDGLDAMGKNMAGSTISSMLDSIVFPEAAVKVGESWDMPKTKKTEVGTLDQTVKATLVGIEKMNDVDAYKITLKGKSKMVSAPAAGDGANPMGNMKTTTETDVDTTIFVEKATGKVLKVTSTGPLAVTTELSDMNMTIPMKGSYTSTIELVK